MASISRGKVVQTPFLTVVDPENWTGALALESPWWGGIQHGTDQEGSRGGVQGQGCPGIGAR